MRLTDRLRQHRLCPKPENLRLHNQKESGNAQHIVLTPLWKAVHQTRQGATRPAGVLQLEVVLAENCELSKEEVKRLATSLTAAAKGADLNIEALDWVRSDLLPRPRKQPVLLSNKVHQESPTVKRAVGVIRLQIGFAEHCTLSEEETKLLAALLTRGAKDSGLNIISLDWVGFESGVLDSLVTVVGTIVYLKAWVRRWRGRRRRDLVERGHGQVHDLSQDQRHDGKPSTILVQRLTAPSSFRDYPEVHNSDDSSSIGSAQSPETYGTSEQLRGTAEYSSVGDGPFGVLSSVSGPGTHDMPNLENEDDGKDRSDDDKDTPETENEDDARDCPDDENVSDSESHRTDGRTHNLPQDTVNSLASAFADHIVENLIANKLRDLFNQPDALMSVEELIRDFTILLGIGVAGNEIQRQAVVFVRHRRNTIANNLASAARAWRPSAENQVSFEEKMTLLHFGDAEPVQYEDPDPEPSSAGPGEDLNHLDELYLPSDNIPELRDVVLARNFLLNSQELPWMIDHIRRMESLSHTGNCFSRVRSQVAQALESHSERIDLSLHWDLLQMLDEQYNEDTRCPANLSDMIVYHGTVSMCYASTTSEYIRQVWPTLGERVIECFDHAIVSPDHIYAIALHNSRLQIELKGTTTDVRLEVTTGKSDPQSRIQMLEVSGCDRSHRRLKR